VSDAAQPDGPQASRRRTVGVGATVATASQIVTAAALGLTGIVVARVLGAGDTGSFNVVLSALVLLAVPSTLGIELGLSYRVSGERWGPAEALRQVQLAALVLGIAGGAIGLGLALAGEGTAFQRIPLSTIVIAIAALPFVLSWTFSSYLALAVDHYEAYGLTPATQAVAALVLVAALSPPFGLTGAVAGLAASHVITSTGVLVWETRALPKPPPGWLARARRELRAAAGFGIKANLNNALQQLNYRADLFLLNAVAASATVGHYAVALTVTTFALLMPRALSSVVLPRVAALDATAGGDEQERMIVKSVRHAVLLVLGASALLAAGLLLVPAVYGAGFEPAVEYGYILIPGVALFGVGSVLAAIVVGKGHPRYSLYNALIVTPPTLVLYALLVPSLKGSGAALASTISYSASAVAWYVFFRRATGLRAPAVLLPGRAELEDYRGLASRVRARLSERASRASTSA
jgi:O-antigen/teichoic acid export membrane protein